MVPQATKGLQIEMLGQSRQSVLEHGCHFSYRTTAMYVFYRPVAVVRLGNTENNLLRLAFWKKT
jgi:hypothetical protein